LVYDEETCRESGPADAAARATRYDAKAAERCLSGMSAALADCAPLDQATLLACRRTLSGDKLPGESCDHASECRRPNDDEARVACVSFCVHIRSGRDGDACGGDDFELTTCEEGLVCDGSRCGPPIGPGGLCDPENDGCAEGLFCDPLLTLSGPGSGHPCAPPRVGQPCSTTGECPPGLGCNPASCGCEPLLSAGTACQSGLQCESQLCGGGKCRAESIASAANCGGRSPGAAPVRCPFPGTTTPTTPASPGSPTPTPAPSP
jgi:hypothetical protein